jgi:predicted porin
METLSMKRIFFGTAALAAAALASAQSSVTMFGVVDATVQRISNSGGPSVTRLTNAGQVPSRLGFRGVEDLGGAMSAGFWLEAGIQNDDGRGIPSNTNNQASGAAPAAAGGQGLTFNRRSTVSLQSTWGELRLGRDFTPQVFNLTLYDPFLNTGAGAAQPYNYIVTGPTAVRASNSIGYFTPATLGGFFAQLMHYRGENASNAPNDGTGTGARLGYAGGVWEAALAVSRTNYAAGDVRQNNIGGSYKFGSVKLMGSLSRDRNGATRGDGAVVGALMQVGAGEVKAAFSQYKIETGLATPTGRKIAVGYSHSLSRRTALYATAARVRNSNGAATSAAPGAAGTPAANGSSTGFDVGVRHSF